VIKTGQCVELGDAAQEMTISLLGGQSQQLSRKWRSKLIGA